MGGVAKFVQNTFSNMLDPTRTLIGGSNSQDAPSAPSVDPVTSANQSRISAATDAQAKANAQIAADKKRRKAGTVFTNAETSTTTTTGKNTLG